MFSTVLAVAAVAGSLVSAAPAPLAPRGAPKTWAHGYLEDYDVYHVRYLALDCQDKHNTAFFQDCCRPMLSTENLVDNRKPYCTPNATEIASADSYISSTAVNGAPKPTSSGTASATVDWEADGYPSAMVASSTAAASSAVTTSSAAVQVAAAPAVESSSSSSSTTTWAAPTSTWVAPTTTQAPTTQAPAPTTQTPQTTQQSNGGGSVQSGGFATYFYQGGNPGACGNYNSDSAHIVAIDSAWWSNFGVQSQYCGRSLTIKNNNNGKTTTATVADVCPTCVNGNSLDLSVGAFTAIASESDGMVPITWWWN